LKRLTFLAAGALVVLVTWGLVYVAGQRASRPPAPPSDVGMIDPWGAMYLDLDRVEADSDLERSIMQSFRSEPEGGFDPDGDGVREYSLLALSGGGSAGAFGAGLLSGWSASGTRPDFKIVTGVSTGSLQSTFAFLGSDYDDALTQVFQNYDSAAIYERRSMLGAVLGDAAWDSAPLKELIERYIDEEVLAAVARKHAAGYRLFVGTVNMDTKKFVIWDMGRIASSQRPDKLQRFRDVLLASCSIPVLFPPVYIPIEVDGEIYYEMHMDGAVKSQLFLRGFMLDFEDALNASGIANTQHKLYLYVIRNGTAGLEPVRDNVPASTLAIATEMINGVFRLSTSASLFRVFMLARRLGADFNVASIPDDFDPYLNPVDFDLTRMKRLYDFAHAEAERGYAWAKQPGGLDPDEVEVLTAPQADGDPAQH